jgi:hypothetical protein
MLELVSRIFVSWNRRRSDCGLWTPSSRRLEPSSGWFRLLGAKDVNGVHGCRTASGEVARQQHRDRQKARSD